MSLGVRNLQSFPYPAYRRSVMCRIYASLQRKRHIENQAKREIRFQLTAYGKFWLEFEVLHRELTPVSTNFNLAPVA
jgi:hypothetical protein